MNRLCRLVEGTHEQASMWRTELTLQKKLYNSINGKIINDRQQTFEQRYLQTLNTNVVIQLNPVTKDHADGCA